ncbi:hypothetical protein [Kineosporia babensis]|uniref:Uncharacterized protein n=1 Tax=Kineosporia babensis TaxID=499548 RepID=A0A9X1NN13_9ACTN|nr:hypothetical protein [Kineosporia babensis]MCD5316724.1 hypothetical protein [Kineosporia babensis]
MMVSVTLSPRDRHDVEPEVMFSAGLQTPASELRHETLLAAGVRVSVDLTTPHRWRSITVASWNCASQSLIRALAGDPAVAEINAQWQPGGPVAEMSRLEADLSGAAPWLRVALADALDRWLHLPLDQSLVDAERGVARTFAALSMPEGNVRTEMLRQALLLTRRSARGLHGFLARIGLHPQPLPLELADGIDRLVAGYQALLDQLKGDDESLRAVVEMWRDMGRTFRTPVLRTHRQPAGARADPAGEEPAAGLIDPRQVPARTLGMHPDPDRPEITVRPAVPGRMHNVRTVVVDVPLFGSPVTDHGPGGRILARLIDRETGRARGETLLTLHRASVDGRRRTSLRGVLRVPPDQEALDLETVRVNVFDALIEHQPAVSDQDPALHNVRRAILALREWRQLVAEARLRPALVRPTLRVREIGRLLLPANEVYATAATGLSRGRYEQLLDLSEDELLDLLQDPELAARQTPTIGNVLSTPCGSNDLLVAELAAAYL